MDYLVRRATIDDAEAIARVHAVSWRTTYQGLVEDDVLDRLERDLDDRVARRIERLRRPELMCWVAVTPGGYVVGFADGGPIRAPLQGYDYELYAIYLLKGWQGCGMGLALVRALWDSICQEGGRSMAVWVLKDNRSRSFYEHLGAQYLMRETIRIGSQNLEEWAYGWDNICPWLHDG